jgi:predicted TIM-barrel fold metal-dependent hydrolase
MPPHRPAPEPELLPCCAAYTRIPEALRPLPVGARGELRARGADRQLRGLTRGFVDTHTHLFPPGFYRAIERWFDQHAWNIAFRSDAEGALDTLFRAGAAHVVGLVYAHKPGVARYLNAFLAELCRTEARVVGVGTVQPGEPDAEGIVREALGPLGLRGIKLHCHVQRVPIDDPRVLSVLRQCRDAGVPAVVHCGRLPKLAAYGFDIGELCGVARAERVLRALPGLKLVVPHLGIDEMPAYLALLEREPGLFLDTTMVCADYFEDEDPDYATLERLAARITYGSDFPLVPYEPTREVQMLARRIASDAALRQILSGTARSLWGL